jgi:hypothetical protein
MINLWIIYTAYATLHFCSCFLYFLLCLLEVVFITSEWNRATNPNAYQDSHSARLDFPPSNSRDPSLNTAVPEAAGDPTLTDPASQTPQQNGPVNPMLYFIFAYIVIYNVLAVVYSWKSYKHFQWLFNVQIAGELGNDEGAFVDHDQENQYIE